MRITFLVDNLPHPTLPLLTEHGLSMYIDQITPNSSLLTPNSILCDMGASGAYFKNAKALGIDLNTCHWAFLSHAHADHTGGLGKWVAQYGHIPVYASHYIPTLQCFSSRPQKVTSHKSSFGHFDKLSDRILLTESTKRLNDSTTKQQNTNSPHHQITASPEQSDLRYIGADLNLFHGHTPWFKPIEQNTWLTPHIALVHPTCSTYPKPLGNKYLTAVASQSTTSTTKRLKLRLSESRRQTVTELVEVRLDYAEREQLHESEARINDSTTQQQNTNSPHHPITASPEQSEIDPFLHEIALCFVTPKGLVIVSCCSHHGALNTIASCMEFTGCNTLNAYIGGLHFVDSPEVEAETTSFISDWLRLYPNAQLYTGHCTCSKAASLLQQHIPLCEIFHTGYQLDIT